MPFFVQDQKLALDRLHANDAQHGDVMGFLSGPFDRFLTERIAPDAARQDNEEWFDEAAFRALGDTGFMALAFGDDVGGLGAPFTYAMAGLESLAKANAEMWLGAFTSRARIKNTSADGAFVIQYLVPFNT